MLFSVVRVIVGINEFVLVCVSMYRSGLACVSGIIVGVNSV